MWYVRRHLSVCLNLKCTDVILSFSIYLISPTDVTGRFVRIRTLSSMILNIAHASSSPSLNVIIAVTASRPAWTVFDPGTTQRILKSVRFTCTIRIQSVKRLFIFVKFSTSKLLSHLPSLVDLLTQTSTLPAVSSTTKLVVGATEYVTAEKCNMISCVLKIKGDVQIKGDIQHQNRFPFYVF